MGHQETVNPVGPLPQMQNVLAAPDEDTDRPLVICGCQGLGKLTGFDGVVLNLFSDAALIDGSAG